MDRDTPRPTIGDAFGEALITRLDGEARAEIIYERDDGFVDADTCDYFASPDDWDERDHWVLERARGRVLDIGAGGGRASLALQDRGHAVVALDVSPGAIETCRRRGVRDLFLGDLPDLAAHEGEKFDSFLFLGNNLGLLGSPTYAATMFDAIGGLAKPGATIAGTCLDPTFGEPPSWHASYHERNRSTGLPPGQIRLRTRFRDLATHWFDLFWMSPNELRDLARESGWEVVEVTPGLLYAAVLERPA